MTANRLISVAFVDGAIGSAIADVMAVPWETLRDGFAWPHRVEGEKLSAPAWLPISLRDGAPLVRKDEHVLGVSALVFDLDDGAEWYPAVRAVRGLGYASAMHTTWSHTPDRCKARVVFPLVEDCPREEWPEVWLCAEQWARTWGATIDKACKNPSRLYFLPSLPAAGWEDQILNFRAESTDGPLLHWRWLQAHHQPPKVPAPPRPPPRAPAWVGRSSQEIDREQVRRRRFALGVLRHRCRGLVEGSRNRKCYTIGRAVAQLAQTGAITEGEGIALVLDAALAAGLSTTEAETAIHNGINTGRSDPPWDFSTT